MTDTMATGVVRKVVRDVPCMEGRRVRTSGGRLRTAPPGADLGSLGRHQAGRPRVQRFRSRLTETSVGSDRQGHVCVPAPARGGQRPAGRHWEAAACGCQRTPPRVRPRLFRGPDQHAHRQVDRRSVTITAIRSPSPRPTPTTPTLARPRPATPVSRTPWYPVDTVQLPPSGGRPRPAEVNATCPARPAWASSIWSLRR